MTAEATRAEKLLQRIVRNGKAGLTPCGADFLVANLDPFHDTQLSKLEGWPDVETGASVVRIVKQSMTISATSGGGSPVTAPWDAHISCVPVMDPWYYDATTARQDNVVVRGNVPLAPFGGLMARGVFNTGQPVNWFPPQADPSLLGSLSLNSQYTKGLSRIIGIGIEVHDVTAAIARQGTATVYCQVEPKDEPNFFTVISNQSGGTSGLWTENLTGTTMRLPPTNIADAMLYPGSRQWKAEEGVYEVGRFHTNENPPKQPLYNAPLWMPEGTDQQAVGSVTAPFSNTTNLFIPSTLGSVNQSYSTNNLLIQGVISQTFLSIPAGKIYPFHNFGCIFSGLNPQSTLTINLNVYVESFPSIADPSILVLATPSCQYDPFALELFSQAISNMPVGVKVAENFTAGWFDGILQKIADWAPVIGTALGTVVPGAAAIGTGVGTVARFMAPANSTVPPGRPVVGPKRKKVKKKNAMIATGNRGRDPKKQIQGPLPRPK